MFEPDTLLPEQYFTLLGRKPLQGEKRLLLAMLEDAVQLFPDLFAGKKAPRAATLSGGRRVDYFH